MIWWWSRVFINKLSEGLLWHLIVTQRSQLAILSSSHNLFSKKLQSYHRIIEYPELEVMYKALQVQLLAAQRTTQNSKPVFESVVQMLSWTPALGAVPTALPLTPNCPSPDSSMPFPQALLLSQRAELSAAPPLPGCPPGHSWPCWLRLNLWDNTQQSNYSEGNVGAGAQPCWVAASSAPGTKYSKRRERFALFSPFTSCSENIYRDRGLQLSAVEVLCSAGEGWRCWSKVRDSMQGAQWGWQSQRGWKAKMYMLMQQRRERANNPGK